MDLALSDEQRIIVDMVRRFVREEIVPLEETLDPDADEVPPEKLAEAPRARARALMEWFPRAARVSTECSQLFCQGGPLPKLQ